MMNVTQIFGGSAHNVVACDSHSLSRTTSLSDDVNLLFFHLADISHDC